MSTETLLTESAHGAEGAEAAAGAGDAATTTTETQGAETQPGGASTEAGTDTQAGEGDEGQDTVAGAPEAYDDFTVTDGIELDAEVLDSFKATAKELNLPQDAAQRVVDLGVQLVERMSAASLAQVTEAQEGWIQASKSDPEFGGDKLEASVALAKKGLDAVGSPALAELLTSSGLGNHPEIIRAFRKVGEAYSEDQLVTGSGGESRANASPAKRIYANMN